MGKRKNIKKLLGSPFQVYMGVCLFSEPLVSMLNKDDLRVKGEIVWQSKPKTPKHGWGWRCLRVRHLACFLGCSCKRAAPFLWAWQLLWIHLQVRACSSQQKQARGVVGRRKKKQGGVGRGIKRLGMNLARVEETKKYIALWGPSWLSRRGY